jgi:hypothetical protein
VQSVRGPQSAGSKASLLVLTAAVVLVAGLGVAVPASALGEQDPAAGAVPADVTDAVTASVGLVRSAGVVGSGWVAEAGTVVTNEHVARTRTGDIYIDYADGERVECYTAVADRDMDLAVLKCPTGARRPLQLGGEPPAASPAAVVGYPGGQGPTTSVGEFTGRRERIRSTTTIGFTAPIAPGSSGSPVVDGRGRVAAVATFGGGWGVPTAELEPLLAVARSYPATKEGAEWRLRLRRGAVALVVSLPIAFVVGRRLGRNDAVGFMLRWSVVVVLVTLAITQVQFMLTGPAHFV